MRLTILPTLIDTLVDQWQALDGYGAPGTANVIPILDGPYPGDVPALAVVVGSSEPWADEENEGTTATSTSEWATVPVEGGNRFEQVALQCAVVASSGTTGYRTLRTQVDAVITDLATDLFRRDTLTGIDVTGLAIGNLQLSQLATTKAAVVQLVFTIDGSFRI